ncbi:P-loop containing nucleoside triphosphate hydrolase protein [Aulographum hederae CBS 113979]|uniref:P-loop containing nucleoside triphosphate hydrolase protein n=1 Tax=Aulographum hederae CBS 113979 TaxID=1176131 RepID=A0A6G1H4W0_9PEZI|nr:P-loop containing nucleoside triphosphate hydrolase protein [Aulographum hederae CBS 113979]
MTSSIFSFEAEPPRISSPWLASQGSISKNLAGKQRLQPTAPVPIAGHSLSGGADEGSIFRLEAEPQDGPTEYKLHLLLRPRRSFSWTSTAKHISGSHRWSRSESTPAIGTSELRASEPLPPSASSQHSRQHRLEQLTTQLLWRLQQSSSFHSSARDNVIAPAFPGEADKLVPPTTVARPLPGLETSKGALYEIGVSDDGTLVGLADDEMEESLNNLRAMAASLGCVVEVVRKISVGDCEWHDQASSDETSETIRRKETLWVAEAHVKPSMPAVTAQESAAKGTIVVDMQQDLPSKSATNQLRVSLTGATASGKSSLLGILTLADLDDGRGKNRLSISKHRHERQSGMTSSVTQELIGYCEDEYGGTQVINYAVPDVKAWMDIHALCSDGRLVLLTDSAGHPRFHRTTVRGLVGWAPHWTLLCIPADYSENHSSQSFSSSPGMDGPGDDMDVSAAHFDLCLKLKLPLVVVITKFDIARSNVLKSTLSRVLTTIKDTGRRPAVFSNPKSNTPPYDLQDLPPEDLEHAGRIADTLEEDCLHTVPIVFTSAVDGRGISNLHALLHELPIPTRKTPQTLDSSPTSENSSILFHIEEVFTGTKEASNNLSILGGLLKCGQVYVGDQLTIGPYATDCSPEDSDSSPGGARATRQQQHVLPTSRSYPGALHKSGTTTLRLHSDLQHEWRRVTVVSIRNLRLPVRTLYAGQVGTMAVAPPSSSSTTTALSTPALIRIRKGMVLLLSDCEAAARRSFVAEFPGDEIRDLPVGSAVVVYIASVRASAKVVSLAVTEPLVEDDVSSLGSAKLRTTAHHGNSNNNDRPTLVTLQFIGAREYVELGAQVLLMPGQGSNVGAGGGGQERGRKGVAALEGFVGRVIECSG